MGSETVQAILAAKNLQLAAALGRNDDLNSALSQTNADVVVDFTEPSVVFANSKTIIEHNVHPVIGTTGLSTANIDELQQRCQQKKLGAIIAPNFSIGAVLMMHLLK